MDFNNETADFFTQCAAWIASIIVGILAKVSTEILMKRKLSFIQWLAIVGVSVFFGYLSAVWCDSSGWVEQGKYIVPLVTLMGEKIMIYLTTNYRRIGDAILSIFTKKNGA
jgi:hypothetical protein